MIVAPDTSITSSTPSVLQVPTQRILLPATTSVPPSITRLSSSVTMRAFVKATEPLGIRRSARSVTSTLSVVCPPGSYE